jgi:protein SCO1/2
MQSPASSHAALRLAIAMTAAIAATVPLSLPARSHSLNDFEQQLQDKEKYFQPVDVGAPDFALQDADGRVFHMTDFRGKVAVLHFIYTNCPDVCPLHAEKIAEIQSMINRTPMKGQVEFVTITTDPKRDTGAVLRDYGKAHGLDPANWVFLTTTPGEPEDTTRKLAQAYGLRFTQTEDGAQMHGVVTQIIDREGHLRARFHGLKFQSVSLVLLVNALVNDVHPHEEQSRRSFWDWLRDLF